VAICALALGVLPTLPSSVGEPTLPGNAGVAAGTPYVRSGVGGRRRLLTRCATDERVVNNECTACPAGTANAAEDDPLGDDTVCDPVYCLEDYRVNNANTCVACATGSVNDADDDAAGPETHCTCPVNYRVQSEVCVECVGGSTRAAGDNPLDLVVGNTTCGCATDERVVNNTCTACPAGTANAAEDDPLGDDTVCDPVYCSEDFRVNDANTCVACATRMTTRLGLRPTARVP
jgi:hypothetical protein